MKTILVLVSWVLSVVMFLIFAISASGKFDLTGNIADNFKRWGIPIPVMVMIGVIELAGAIMLLIPKWNKIAIPALVSVMLGSVATHIVQFDELGLPILPLGMIITLVTIQILRTKITALGNTR